MPASSQPGVARAGHGPGSRARAVRHASAHQSDELHNARADLLQWEGAWVVSELELIEPGLYLDVLESNAAASAEMVTRVLD